MDRRDAEMFAQAVAPVVREFIKQAIEPLQKRIVELETRESQFKYTGTWQAANDYRKGNFATFAGGVWHCNRDTNARPGTCDDWTLAVKAQR